MNIQIGEIIELDEGKEFICFSTAEMNGNTYIYLMSNFKPLEIKFAKLLNTNSTELELEIINNQDKIKHYFYSAKLLFSKIFIKIVR